MGIGDWRVTSTVVTIGPDGQPMTAPMSAETGARVEAALSKVFGQAGAQAFGQAFGQAAGDAAAFSQASWSDQSPAAAPHGGFNPAEAARPLPEQASAIVLAAQDAATPPGFAAPGGTVDLTLEVTRADGPIYTTPARLSFSTPERRAAVATPGTRLRVRIDPNIPARIAIDTAGLF